MFTIILRRTHARTKHRLGLFRIFVLGNVPSCGVKPRLRGFSQFLQSIKDESLRRRWKEDDDDDDATATALPNCTIGEVIDGILLSLLLIILICVYALDVYVYVYLYVCMYVCMYVCI